MFTAMADLRDTRSSALFRGQLYFVLATGAHPAHSVPLVV